MARRRATVSRQAIYLASASSMMLGASRLDYWRLRSIKWLLYPLLIGSILLVIGAGSAVNGASRALTIGGISFQASELGKVLLIVFLAAIVADSPRKASATELTLKVVAFALVPAALVIAEPDLGSGLVYFAIAFAILFVAGIPARQLTLLARHRGGSVRLRARDRPSDRVARPQEVPGAAPDRVPQPLAESQLV